MSAVKSQTSDELVTTEITQGVCTITLNQPHRRNPLSSATMAALQNALNEVRDDGEVQVVVIASTGPAFCAGHDLKEIRSKPQRPAHEALMKQCSEMMMSVTLLPKPVIAKVDGIATAAGCQLVASCDLAIASNDSLFATPGVNIGLFCSTPMVALSRSVGRKAAMEMLLTGDLISADKAKEIGLLNRVVPADKLDQEVTDLANQIAGKSPLTLAIGKEAFYRQVERCAFQEINNGKTEHGKLC